MIDEMLISAKEITEDNIYQLFEKLKEINSDYMIIDEVIFVPPTERVKIYILKKGDFFIFKNNNIILLTNKDYHDLIYEVSKVIVYLKDRSIIIKGGNDSNGDIGSAGTNYSTESDRNHSTSR